MERRRDREREREREGERDKDKLIFNIVKDIVRKRKMNSDKFVSEKERIHIKKERKI